MTGFASTQRVFPGGTLFFELRSVNSRFLDVNIKLPDELRIFEPMLREKIAANLLRGKIECRLTLQHTDQHNSSQLLPDESVLVRLRHWQSKVLEYHPHACKLSVSDLLRWPGVLGETTKDTEAISQVFQNGLEDCLQQLQVTRRREGSKLASILLDRCQTIAKLIQQLEPKLPTIREMYQKRALEKLSEVLGLIASHGVRSMSQEEITQRLSTEVAIYVLRTDVDEELERLKTHLKEVERILTHANSKGMGKRLDFLMQELHREANTLGSKSLAIEMSHTALEIKLLIEQMREQVQNIE